MLEDRFDDPFPAVAASLGRAPRLSSQLLAIGHYVPPRVVSNQEMGEIVGLSPEEIQKRTGVVERRFVTPGTSCSELALHATENALQRSGLRKEEIDCIILATLSPDHFFPGTGCFLQERLGLPGIPAFDIRNQCSGFLYGLAIADHFVQLGTYQRVLVVGAEIHSSGLDFSAAGKSLSILFGDAAACIILGPSTGDSKILSLRLHADGRFARELWVESPSSTAAGQIDHADIDRGAHYPRMRGGVIFRNAVRRLCEVVPEVLPAPYRLEDVSLFVFHQANLRIITAVMESLGIPESKVANSIERYGNTTAASIPLGLSEAQESGRLKRGDLVLLAAFGAGFTWAAALFRY